MSRCRLLLCLIAVLALSACATGRSPAGSATVEAQSQMTGGSDAWQRAKVHTELAALYYRDGNMAVALEELRVAREAESSYAPIYNMYGLVHMHLREFARADENFRHALSLAGSDPEINNNYGWFLCQTGKPHDSLSYFMAAVKNSLYSTPELAYFNAGSCALRAGEETAAEDYLHKALRLGRPVPQVYLPLATIQFRRGNLGEAKRLLSELYRLTEPSAEALWLSLRIERKLGDRLAEAGYATQLRRRFPNSPESLALSKGNFE